MAEQSRPRRVAVVQGALDAIGAGPTSLGVQGALNQMAAAERVPAEPSPLEQLKAAAAVLVEAAAGAEALLPSMEKRRMELAKELTELESQITRLRTIVHSAEPYRIPQERQAPEPIIDGAAGPDIDQVLFETDNTLRVSDIRELIIKRTGREWAVSTISNHLSRGKAQGRYINENTAWKLSNKGVADLLK